MMVGVIAGVVIVIIAVIAIVVVILVRRAHNSQKEKHTDRKAPVSTNPVFLSMSMSDDDTSHSTRHPTARGQDIGLFLSDASAPLPSTVRFQGSRDVSQPHRARPNTVFADYEAPVPISL